MVGGSVHLREDGGATVNQVQVAATRNQVSGNFQASKTRRGCSFGTVHCADVATLPASVLRWPPLLPKHSSAKTSDIVDHSDTGKYNLPSICGL